MPSGAKKRKAAKKKLQKVHNFDQTHASYSNSRGSDDPTSHDEKDNDAAIIERKENVKEENEANSGDGNAVNNEVARGFHNGNKKSSSSSSSSSNRSSSSDDDEIAIEKEKPNKPEIVKTESSEENSGGLEVVNEAVQEKIPTEESVKEVVSSPQVPVDYSSTSGEIESDLKRNVKLEVASEVKKSEEQRCCGDDESKALDTDKNSDKQPLLSTAPIPVRRTSWMDCCGLFEAFSGESSR